MSACVGKGKSGSGFTVGAVASLVAPESQSQWWLKLQKMAHEARLAQLSDKLAVSNHSSLAAGHRQPEAAALVLMR